MRTLFAFFLTVTALSYAASYSIDKFETNEPFGSPDEFIDAEFNGELKKANANSIRSDRFYVRQKFEDPFDFDATTYQLFEGKVNSSNMGKLSKFSHDKIPYSKLLKLKFYSSKTASAGNDIDRIYFDGNFFYVDGEDNIYVHNDGDVIALKASVEKPSEIDFSTQPSGAQVFIDQSSKGTTPTKITFTGTSATLVTFKKAGYYNATKLVNPEPGSKSKESVMLIKKDTLENLALVYQKEQKQLQRKGDKDGLEDLKNTIERAISDWDYDANAKINSIIDNYPPNADQASGESADSYKTRTQAWEDDREAEENALKASAEKIKSDLEALLESMDDAISSAGMGGYGDDGDDGDDVEIPEPDYSSVADEVYAQDYDDSFTDINSVFDRSDEYRKWGAWALVAGSAASLTVGVLQQMKYNDLKKNYDASQEMIDTHIDQLRLNKSCSGNEICTEALIAASRNEDNGFLKKYEPMQKENKKVLNSYSSARNLFLILGGLGVAGSIVLFTW